MKILWLVSWYPSKPDAFNGDFIQRHAEAASLFNDIDVIYVIKDAEGSITRNYKIIKTTKGRLSETVVYYYAPFSKIVWVHKLISEWKYRKYFREAIAANIKKGKPDLVHVHVCMKAGILALWVKKKFSINFVLTEHSSAFFSEAKNTIHRQFFYFRIKCKRIIKEAAAISVVSGHLGKSMKLFLQNKTYTVLPNVVNTAIFKPLSTPHIAPANFIHVSSLAYAKNPENMLQAFALVKQKGHKFCLDIFGPLNKWVVDKVNTLGLSECIFFHGEVPQTELARFMQKAQALILYSRYETFGCVVIEANACGIPVIVSDIPVLQEKVEDTINGFIAGKENSASLAEKIILFINGQTAFDPVKISQQASQKYSYQTVGLLFHNWYKQCCNK